MQVLLGLTGGRSPRLQLLALLFEVTHRRTPTGAGLGETVLLSALPLQFAGRQHRRSPDHPARRSGASSRGRAGHRAQSLKDQALNGP